MTSTAHLLSPNNRWASAGRYLRNTSRLMNAILWAIIAYFGDYVKSEYLHECETIEVFGLGIVFYLPLCQITDSMV